MITEEENGDIIYSPPFTSGPWCFREVELDGEDDSALVIVANRSDPASKAAWMAQKNMKLEEIEDQPVIGKEIEIAIIFPDDVPGIEQTSNAVLLRHAPDLFQACVFALMELKNHPSADPDVLEYLRHVLNSATNSLVYEPILGPGDPIESLETEDEAAVTQE